MPTGISVSMQDSRSQHEVRLTTNFTFSTSATHKLDKQNRTKAYKVLRARLMDRRLTLEMEARRSERLTQVRGADRSEKIRTYNFPQVRPSYADVNVHTILICVLYKFLGSYNRPPSLPHDLGIGGCNGGRGNFRHGQ